MLTLAVVQSKLMGYQMLFSKCIYCIGHIYLSLKETCPESNQTVLLARKWLNSNVTYLMMKYNVLPRKKACCPSGFFLFLTIYCLFSC